MEYINELEIQNNYIETENGDLAYKSTFDKNVDLFSISGALRYNAKEFNRLFIEAYFESKNLAIKNLFYLRDPRGGLGERNLFSHGFRFLADTDSDIARKLLPYVIEYGRYDDILYGLCTDIDSDIISLIKNTLKEDIKNIQENRSVSLLAKWLPSINTSNKDARMIAKSLCKKLNISCADYRKTLSMLRKNMIIENNLRNKDYSFDYSKIPSLAMHKYTQAFERNDKEKYKQYLADVKEGKALIHADTLYPYDVIREYSDEMSKTQRDAMQVKWDALERYDIKENTIVVRDGSASMEGHPDQIATSLSILLSEMLPGFFKNRFITFSKKPMLINLKGGTLYNKLKHIYYYDDCTNTNIEKVYNLLLNVASKEHIKKEDMIERIIIISDMEFDQGVSEGGRPTYESFKDKYEKLGYKMPEVVYWNVCARRIHFATLPNKSNVKLISGASQKIIKSVIENKGLNQCSLMNDVLGKYSFVDEIVND